MPTNKVLVFSEKVKGWVSFRSHIDMQNGISMGNDYYTFAAAKLWKHYEEGTVAIPHPRNTFYGPYPEYFTPTSLTAILNDAPGSVKSFNTINYEGSQSRVVQNLQDNEYYNLISKNGWYIDSIFTDKEQGTIDEFIEKEGKWFNYIKGKEVQHFIDDSSNNPFTGIVLNDNGTSSLEQGSFAVQGIGTLSTLTSVQYFGCTDPTAFNYQPTAAVDDDSCIAVVNGCMIASASNYNSSVNTSIANYCQWIGCTDATAFNYTFFPPIAFTYNNGNNIIDNGLCVATVLGCVDATAFNYNTSANTDDGTCLPFIYGCTDPTSFNYNSSANTADPNDPCEAVTLGCMDPTACNYSAFVNTDNGSCVYSNQPPAVACYETATFNPSLCAWEVTGSPVSIVITQSPPGAVCPNTSVTFQRNMYTSSAIGKQWNKNGIAIPGATATTYSTTDPGSYSLTLTDANGCASTSNSLDLINTIVNTPSGLFTSNIELTKVTMNWGLVSNAHHYDIQFRTAGTSWPATPQFQNIPYTVESQLKSNLTSNTNYEWQIRSACSTNSSTDTAWSATQFVTTAAPCVVPTIPVTTGITTTTATLGWNVVSGAWGYKVRYKKVDDAWVDWTYVVVTPNSYALTGLVSGTAYHWQVASMCDANGSNNSGYTGYTVFNTTTTTP
jgi:hypothetical protein